MHGAQVLNQPVKDLKRLLGPGQIEEPGQNLFIKFQRKRRVFWNR